MSNVTPFIRGSREAPKAARSKMDTLLVTVDEISNWRVPPFQRPVRINAKVQAIAEAIKHEGGILPGIVTLGRILPDKTLYIVDGQHRIEAGRMSGMSELMLDVRIVDFADMGEMAEEFVQLNSALVRMRPDDILRGLEASNPQLGKVRRACPYVGYDQIRRNGGGSPVVGMSALLRCWFTSAREVPQPSGLAISEAVGALNAETADQLATFMEIAFKAWGRDAAYFRLWGNLNLTLCMWLYRRTVLDRNRAGNKRVVVLSAEQFRKCLMALSANGNYVDFLGGRLLNDRDRSPTYMRIKKIFADRIVDDGGAKPSLPQPAWAA